MLLDTFVAPAVGDAVPLTMAVPDFELVVEYVDVAVPLELDVPVLLGVGVPLDEPEWL